MRGTKSCLLWRRWQQLGVWEKPLAAAAAARCCRTAPRASPVKVWAVCAPPTWNTSTHGAPHQPGVTTHRFLGHHTEVLTQ
eukprot:1158681-Pelagomonas_calceolata.AAC.4